MEDLALLQELRDKAIDQGLLQLLLFGVCVCLFVYPPDMSGVVLSLLVACLACLDTWRGLLRYGTSRWHAPSPDAGRYEHHLPFLCHPLFVNPRALMHAPSP